MSHSFHARTFSGGHVAWERWGLGVAMLSWPLSYPNRPAPHTRGEQASIQGYSHPNPAGSESLRQSGILSGSKSKLRGSWVVLVTWGCLAPSPIWHHLTWGEFAVKHGTPEVEEVSHRRHRQTWFGTENQQSQLRNVGRWQVSGARRGVSGRAGRALTSPGRG